MKFESIRFALSPRDATPPKLNLQKPTTQASLDKIEGTLEGEPIQHITFVANVVITEGAEDYQCAQLLVELASGKLLVFDVAEGAGRMIFIQLFSSKATIEGAFNQFGRKRDSIWDRVHNKLSYSELINAFYQKLHHDMAKELLTMLLATPSQHSIAKTAGIQLISTGCGTADDLFAFYTNLITQGFDCECIGLDTNRAGLARAAKEKPPHFRFINHDLTQIDSLSPALFSTTRLKIIISSGSLTREVLNGAYSVAQVLQKLLRLKADIVVLSGYTHVMVTKKIAKSIGYSASVKPIASTGQNLFMLSNQEAHEYQTYIEKSSVCRSRSGKLTVLDLSLSAFPLRMCDIFAKDPRKENITQIDFSWSFLTEADIAALPALLVGFPNLRHITLSNCEPWAKEFIQHIGKLNRYIILQRQDCSDKDELPPLSIAFARALGCFNFLPSKTIVEPKVSLGSSIDSHFAHQVAPKSDESTVCVRTSGVPTFSEGTV